jgi:AcrR family transcriptional regulator
VARTSGARAEARADPGPLSRDSVLRAALELVDREGVDALTIRGVAEELGAKPMSLYSHVADKEDLLGGLLDLVVAEQRLPSFDQPWQKWVKEGSREIRRVLLRHPNAVAAVTRGPTPFRIGTHVQVVEMVLAAFQKAGFDLEIAVHVYRVAVQFVVASVLSQINTNQPPPGLVDVLAHADDFPNFTRALPHYLEPDFERTFELGLDFVIGGAERLLEEDRKRRSE